MRFGSILKVGILLGVLLLALGVCYAQTTRGIIAGTVTDSTGAVVTGAAVNVERMEGGDKRTTATGPNGEYRVEALTPGTYKVTVTSANFAATQVSNVAVSPTIVTSLNVKLEVGKASETITVESGGAQVQTESGDLSGVIPTAQVKDLPILSGNPYELARTLPGVAVPDQRDDFTNGSGFSVDGLRPRANNFLIDGFDNNDYGITGQALQPTNQEAIADVTVLKNAYTAEYGRGGGSVSNLTIRSGTNNFHGAGWYQYSGASLNAVSQSESQSGLTRPAHIVNNLYGFRIGGPVIKSKLFLFGTSQWFRGFGAQNPPQLTVPTAAGVTTLQSIAGNANVQLLLDSLGSFRAVNSTGTVDAGDRPGCTPCLVDVGLVQRTDSGKSLSREWQVRADYLPTASDTVYVRYTDTHSSLSPDLFANSTALPTQDTQQGGPARNLGVMWAHTFNPGAVNELRFSGQQIDFEFGPLASTLANPIAQTPGFTFADSFGITAFGGFSQGTFPQGRAHKTFQVQDAVAITKGSHTFKLGADVAVILVKDNVPFNADGLLNFTGGGSCTQNGNPTTCSDLANFIDDFTGSIGSLSKQFGLAQINVPTNQQGYYFQDSWKLRSNLTLNYGIRYEYQPPDASNVLQFPSINRATVLSDPVTQKTLVKPDRNNWGPRFGFAYTPKFWSSILGSDKTVIRGGAGIFYDTFFTNISDNTAATFPNTLGGQLIANNENGGRGLDNAFESVNAITANFNPFNTLNSVTSDLRNPLTYQWNLNIQRELPAHFIADVAYVGTRGTGLFVNEQLNPRDGGGPRLNPNRGSMVVRGNRGDSIYHGLQTEVNRTYGRLNLRASYTWSKVLDNGSEIFATTGGASRWQNVRDPRSDRGPSAFDRRHRASFAWIYELPGPSRGILKAVLGGWQSGGIVTFQSGAPETLYLGGFDQNGDGEGFNDRPSLGNPGVPINFSNACLNNIFDPATPGSGCNTGFGLFDGVGYSDVYTGLPGDRSNFKYIANLIGENGNVQRNSIFLPGQQTWNLTAIKRFHIPVTEQSEMEFRADFFNAFNHPNLGVTNLVGLGNLLQPSNFLDFASTKDGSRQIQVWMKLSF